MMKRNWRKKGSLLIVSMLFSTMLLHGAIAALPLWERIKLRSNREELGYRCDRINMAINRYQQRNGRAPDTLNALVSTDFGGPFIPRVYGDLVTGELSVWKTSKDVNGGIIEVKSAHPGV